LRDCKRWFFLRWSDGFQGRHFHYDWTELTSSILDAGKTDECGKNDSSRTGRFITGAPNIGYEAFAAPETKSTPKIGWHKSRSLTELLASSFPTKVEANPGFRQCAGERRKIRSTLLDVVAEEFG